MKFRKKPVVIDAIQLSRVTHTECCEFIGDSLGPVNFGAVNLIIKTLEGEMLAIEGDWIIKGIKGEFYPCKPDIFEATYEKVED